MTQMAAASQASRSDKGRAAAATPVIGWATDQPQYLTFDVAGEQYGVGILRVREILEYDSVTRVPGAPPFIRGVINLRGIVLPVLDLARKYGIEAQPVTKRTCIIVVELAIDGEQAVVGVIADSVRQVVELAPEDIEPPPSFGTPLPNAYLLGMGKLDGRFVLILDVERLLSVQEVEALAEASEAETDEDARAAHAAGDETEPSGQETAGAETEGDGAADETTKAGDEA